MTDKQEQERPPHWLDDEKSRGYFWARATELGLDHKDVKHVLGVEHVHDFAGTAAEAVAALEQHGLDEVAVKEPTEPAMLFELARELPEAPVITWTKFIDRDGFVWSLTIRAGLPNEAATEALRSAREQMEMFGKAAKHYGWIPYANGNGGPVLPPARQEPASAQAPSAPGQAPPVPGQTQQGGNGSKSGVAQLTKIAVDADGRVEFYCAGFRWPFKDSRGPETVAALFDASAGGWTPAHFAPGAKYEGLALRCHWEKPEKYYDVVKITA